MLEGGGGVGDCGDSGLSGEHEDDGVCAYILVPQVRMCRGRMRGVCAKGPGGCAGQTWMRKRVRGSARGGGLFRGRVRKRGGGEPRGRGGRRRRQAPPTALPDLPAPPPAPAQSLSARSRRHRDSRPAAAAASSRAPPPPPPAARIPSRRGKQVRQRRRAPRLPPPPTPPFPSGGRSAAAPAALRGPGLGRRGTTAEDCGEWGSPPMRAEGPGDECVSGAAERAAASSAPRGGVRCRSGGRQQRHLRARARRRDAQRFAGIRAFLVSPFYREEN